MVLLLFTVCTTFYMQLILPITLSPLVQILVLCVFINTYVYTQIHWAFSVELLIIIRPHRSNRWMQLIATGGVALSICVCLSLCWSRSWALLKRLNWSRCGSGEDSGESKEPCVRWGPAPPREGSLLKGCLSHRNHCSSELYNNSWTLTLTQYTDESPFPSAVVC